MPEKELFIRLTVCDFREHLSNFICVLLTLWHCGWDVIVLIPVNSLSIYFGKELVHSVNCACLSQMFINLYVCSFPIWF